MIPVIELTDKHLLAEHHELPRIFGAALRWYDAGKYHTEALPVEYCMGKGHMKFFYNKLMFCFNRQRQLYDECKRRDFDAFFDTRKSLHDFHNTPSILLNNYTPTAEALDINRRRIKERLSEANRRHLAKRMLR